MRLPARRAGWNGVSCRMSTHISHPWSARREGYGRARKDPRNAQGVFLAHPSFAMSSVKEVRLVAPATRIGDVKRREQSKLSAMDASFGVAVGRRLVPAANSARVPQPGRERPPSVARHVVRVGATI